MRKSHYAAVERRFITLSQGLLEDTQSYLRYSDATFGAFVTDHGIPANLRAFIGWFALCGTMPNESDIERLIAVIGTSDHNRISRWLHSCARRTGKSARYRDIRLIHDSLYDLTNVSVRIASPTGIPRVSSQFLDGNPDLHDRCFIWSDGVMESISYRGKSEDTYLKAKVFRSGRTKSVSRMQRYMTEWILRKNYSSNSRILYYIMLLTELLTNRLVRSVTQFRRTGPSTALLPLATVLIMEPVSSEATSRYIVLKHCLPSTRLSLMIYDLLPLHLPNNFLPIVVENYVHKLRLLKYCDSLATDSVHLIPVVEGALQLMQVRVAPQILARPLHIERKWLAIELRKPPQVVQFLQIGALENRKNHQLALSAFSQLRIAGRQYNIVGLHKRRSRLISELTEAVRLTSGSVRFLYGLSDEDIIELSRSVTAMVYPSTAEGYGLPILEGLAMGLPVIASDIAPHRQFNDLGGIVYFDPTSVTDLRQAMELVADPDENWRLRLSIQSDRIPANPNEWARETRLALET